MEKSGDLRIHDGSVLKWNVKRGCGSDYIQGIMHVKEIRCIFNLSKTRGSAPSLSRARDRAFSEIDVSL